MVDKRLGYIIKRTQQLLRLQMDGALDTVGLTTPQYAALSILEEDEGLSNAELARRCFVTPQTMHKIVKGLEEKSYVRRQSDPTHGRKINTLLTSSGEEILQSGHEIVEDIETEMTQDLTKGEVAQTVKHLSKCIESLESSS
ncbi:MarR family winged helix-turn-helix transcriptional regulator [Fodinibius halophilus]|uniref:MarR family transcriptional regulator n=1 Tax=Fodinibius halophilus TaxID=1736908 RepID=A0A6M1TBY5_9BACT|nr:MarR family transcriptional regulator [Fodinibius halophilus]NGP89501.1 MarR family transcriptional regulator [Fodinibius halophilus]